MSTVDLSHMQDHPRARALRKHCIDFMRKHTKPRSKISVAMSGGVDSHICLFAALAVGHTPTVYSFTLEDRESRDFKAARATADYFGLEFVPIYLPLDIVTLQHHVWDTYHKYMSEYAIGKTTVECTWPPSYLYKQFKGDFLMMGHGGDAPYCSSRKQKKLYLAGEYESMLKTYYSYKHNDLQLIYADRYMKVNRKGGSLLCPLYDPHMLEIFKGFDPFSKTDNPTGKAVSRAAFWDYFSQVRVFGQQSFQKGDTGIADHFENLMKTEWQGTGTTVKSIYNRVEHKEVEPPKKNRPAAKKTSRGIPI